MIYPCKYGSKCLKGGFVDTDNDAYSVKKAGTEVRYWHYKCYLSNQPHVMYLDKDVALALKVYLSGVGLEDRWVKEVLISLAEVK